SGTDYVEIKGFFHLFRKGGYKIAAPRTSRASRPFSRLALPGLRAWVVAVGLSSGEFAIYS
ncbi:MAG: hypothetical protein AAGD28_25990, partial [Bacteroidota bacterium]